MQQMTKRTSKMEPITMVVQSQSGYVDGWPQSRFEESGANIMSI